MVVQGKFQKQSHFDPAVLSAFGEGITSTTLRVGREDNVPFDEITKARIFLSQDEIDEHRNRWLVGNMDIVISLPEYSVQSKERKKENREIEYTILRIKFDLRYQIDTLEIISFDVYSDASLTDVEVYEQAWNPSEQKCITYGSPLEGDYHIIFWNKAQGCAAKYDWRYQITVNEDEDIFNKNGDILLEVQKSEAL